VKKKAMKKTPAKKLFEDAAKKAKVKPKKTMY